MVEIITILDAVMIVVGFLQFIITVWLWVKVDDVQDDIDDIEEEMHSGD